MARSVLYMRPDGTPVYASSVVREEKAAARTKKARQKPIVKRRKAIASGTAPAVARAQTPLRPAPSTRRMVRRAPVDPIDLVNQTYLESKRREERRTRPSREVQTGGLPDRLQLLRNDSGDSWLGGLVQNAARGGLNIATGLPGAAQLVGENFAAFNPVVGPLRFVPGLDAVDRYQDRVARADKDAANAQYEWATYNFGPLARGDIRTFGQRVYDDPVGILSTFAAGAGAVARAGNIGSRITRVVAPRSQAAARASKRLSELPHRERAAIVTQENLRRREEGKPSLPFEPGHGNRHRPPRQVRSTVGANEPGVPVAGEIVRAVPRKGYSYNPITRTVQRKLDKARDRARPGVEGRAHRAGDIGEDAGFLASMKAIGLSPVTAEGKAGRSLKRETLDMADRYDSRAEVDVNQKANGLARALHRLKKDKTAAGIPGKERISTEEMAVTLHFHDSASARGGKSAVQVRDQVVRSLEGGIRRRITTEARQLSRKNKNMTYPQAVAAVERAPWVAEARAQVETVKRVPEHLLRLEGDAPDVVRVRTAVTEGRRADVENQRQSVAAEVVRPETAEAIRSRTSSLWLGGSKWWQDAVRDVQRKTNPKIQGLRKAIKREREAGNHVKARKLEAQLKQRIEERRRRIAKIKAGATRRSPELDKARAAFVESNTRLSEAKQVGTPNEISAATRARDAHKKRLDKMERESLGFTKARRPEMVGDSGVYIPDRLPAPLRKKGRQTGPRASRIGPDQSNRSKGYLKTSAGFDMHPALMMHQTMRASANYTGRISKAATRELISTIAYRVPGSDKFLTGDSKLLSKITDPSKVAWISQKKLDRVLKELDDLPEGKWMDEADVRDVFADRIPEGANKSDYVAVHADSKDVWTEAMTDGNKLLRYYDTGMTYWKGGLLALSPKWYLNNTFGLALQYGVMTGADLSAIFRGNSRVVREAIEKRAPWVAKDTIADETRGNVKVIRVIRRGFEINSKLEEFWRRAAYANRAKRILGNEGIRYSRLNSAEFAKALETMPDSAVRSIARDVDFFIGNYRKFNKFEQRVMRRVIPFYSWLRVISRLTFGMPFRSPTRLALMNVLANASAAGIDPNRYDLPWYERSAFVIGNKRVGVNAANPGATLAGLMTAAGAESPGRAAFKEMQGWLTPAATAPFSWSHGMNNFGNVISPSPGAAPFGRDKEFVNPVTGVADSQSAGIPASEALLSNLLPGQVGMARKGFSGGWTPRDDTTTLAIVQDFMNRLGGGERNHSLYFNQNPDRPLVPYGFTPYLSMLTGANVRRLDQRKLAQKIREDQARIRRQNASLRRARERAKRP